jgi:predicted helicase
MSTVNRDRGTWFEELMVTFLQTDPTYADQFSDVWMWMDWPERDGGDAGIDLVAREREGGGYVAIQCKFYEPTHTLQKSDIDSFFTASGKHPFTRRLIISTTDKWGPNAEKALTNQQIPVNRLGMAELMDSPVEWDAIAWPDAPAAITLPVAARKVIRNHQRTAINKVLGGFAVHDRGKLIMACGTGKTFTSLKLAEEIATTNDAEEAFVLFCVPSISLLSQTLKEWTAQCGLPLRSFAVCSDTRVSRASEDIAAHDLAFPATTSAAQLVEHASKDTVFNDAGLPGDDAGKRLSVVFTTYQSIGVIHEAQKLGLPDFDLILCDEAHRTTGVTVAGADESAFVKIHDNNFISGRKRLYMTATPKLFKDDVKQAAKERDAVLCSMDNEDLYGPELHRLGFGEAVDKGLLTDYKVLILTVDEKYLNRSLQSQIADDNNEISLDDAVKIIGCWNGLAKRSGQFADGTGFEAGEPSMRRAVAFNRTIADSKKIVDKFSEVLDAYNDAHEGTLRTEVEHVDGTFNALHRNRLLEWLKEPTPTDTCRILSNAKCLSEGVDVPDLDAVLFLSPRNSQVDVVQSVGRVMRKADHKKYGYIILPVGIPSDMAPEEALKDNKRYKVVWQVLQALRAHDDRFNATINKIDLNRKKPKQIMVGYVHGGDEDSSTSGGTSGGGKQPETAGEKADAGTQGAKAVAQQLAVFPVDQWRDAIYAKIVTKCGEKAYWEQWAQSVADIAARHVDRINVLIEDPHSDKAQAFERFLEELRATINPGVSRDDAIDMLAQHLITKPVFDAIFGSYEFSEHNPVSQTMQRMLDTLEDQALGKELDTLEDFYANVRIRAEGIDNHEGRQTVITELYERFFKTALPKTADAFGIVYTPIPVVDFILRATNQALQRHFDAALTDEGVQILDPFTGTGTFIVRLLQSGLISPDDLLRKYTSELHANEILLLAYYIAAINIEAAFHQTASRNIGDTEYTPFDGIVLTDTFQLAESTDQAFPELLAENNERIQRQKNLDIRVIIGNPPYSVGQDSANDNNQNQKYPVVDGRIEATYAKRSTATNKNSLYDSYIRAIRWASDRIGADGVIGFVSNGGYIDSNTADGLRLSLADEFTDIYCYNLRGNARTAGELRRKESGNVFESGSRSTVAILMLVKSKDANQKAAIRYRDIGDYLTRERKLAILDNDTLDTIDWQTITPNEHGDWINQRSGDFHQFTPIGDKGSKDHPAQAAIFSIYSAGLQTNRDAWVYNFSTSLLVENVSRTIGSYEAQRAAFNSYCVSNGIGKRAEAVADWIDSDPQKISWSRSLRGYLARNSEICYEPGNLAASLYRPFTKQRVYFDKHLNHERSQLPKLFPGPTQAGNYGFYVVGNGSDKPFSALATDLIPDLAFWGSSNGQFFPRWSYEPVEDDDSGQGDLLAISHGDSVVVDGWRRVDNITDAALADYQASFGSDVTKDDIFFYVYGLLHSPEYRDAYAADLKKMLPRIPKVKAFTEFVQAGRQLSEIHIGYERVDTYPLTEQNTAPADADPYATYRVQKMTLVRPERDRIVYNAHITLSGIPDDAHRYMLGSRSALEWIIERYQVKTDKDSRIVNDPNDWAKEVEDPRYIVDLVKRIVTVSVETMKIVDSLPPLEIVE